MLSQLLSQSRCSVFQTAAKQLPREPSKQTECDRKFQNFSTVVRRNSHILAHILARKASIQATYQPDKHPASNHARTRQATKNQASNHTTGHKNDRIQLKLLTFDLSTAHTNCSQSTCRLLTKLLTLNLSTAHNRLATAHETAHTQLVDCSQ